MGVSAAVVAVGALAAYSVDTSQKQKSAADENIKNQNIREQALEAKAKERTAAEENDATATKVRDAAHARQLSENNTGRSSTILTSPLGVTESQTKTGGKTLLGM